ncbi:flagellum-specific ATP synthase [compost metagenome]
MAIKQVPVIYDVLTQTASEPPTPDAFSDLAGALKAAAMGNQPGAAGMRPR